MFGHINRASERAGRAVEFLILAVAVMSWAEVLLRYVFNRPTVWLPELVIACSATAFLFGGALAMRHGGHIRITYICEQVSAPWQRAFDVLSLACACVFIGGMIYGAFWQFHESVSRFNDGVWAPETTGRAWDVPLPPALRLAMLLAAILLLLQTLAHYWRAIRGRSPEVSTNS